VVASYLFDGYGVRKVASSDPTAPQDPYSGYGGLAGYYTDWETGLCLLGFRYYDVLAGRFLTRDPIGFVGGINLYEYVGNSPLVRHDPLGYLSFSSIGSLLSRIKACIGTLVRLIDAISNGRINNVPSGLCFAGIDCLMSLLCSGLLTWIGRFEAPIIGGCAAGAICSILRQLADGLCGFLTCKRHYLPPSLPSLLCGGLAGCIGGIATGVGSFTTGNLGVVCSRIVGIGIGIVSGGMSGSKTVYSII